MFGYAYRVRLYDVPTEPGEGEGVIDKRLEKLHEKLRELGIEGDPNQTGQYMHSTCPQVAIPIPFTLLYILVLIDCP